MCDIIRHDYYNDADDFDDDDDDDDDCSCTSSRCFTVVP